MAKKSNYEDWRGKYNELKDRAPVEGGNGKVYFVRKSGEELALKQLKESFARNGGKTSSEKKRRFRREIQIVKSLAKDLPNVIPIYDYSDENFWYVMPIAEGIMEHMTESKNRLIDATNFVLELAETLSRLHDRGVCHRDIKPDNIYFYKGRCCLSDFGIAGIMEPEGRITPADKQLGAIFTIAPEMKRYPLEADGKKADVFSLAKTLWMLIRNNNMGFDGSYDRRNSSIGLSFAPECKGIHLVELEDLLESATDIAPERRPDMIDFVRRLRLWQEIQQDRTRSQNSDWSYLSRALFAGNQTSSATWTDINAIVTVLQEIARLPAYNHIFLPNKGGLDLVGAERAAEEGCLYLIFDPIGVAVVKPKSLTFEGFVETNDWNFFLLKLENLKPIHKTEDMECICEFLVEDTPGHYISADTFVYGVYDYDTGEPLPAEAKRVARYCRGSFLITLKQGPYNQSVDYAYQALHDSSEIRDIRAFMTKLRRIQHMCERNNCDFGSVINGMFRKRDQRLEDQNRRAQERRAYINERQKMDTYLQEHLSEWQFACPVTAEMETSRVRYTFGLRPENSFSLSKGLPKEYKLCKDGVFREKSVTSEEFQVWTADETKKILQSLQTALNEYLNKAGYIREFYTLPNIHVELEMIKEPPHLVTKEEIRKLMIEADDRQDNTLVLDGDGYPHIINDSADSVFYPVSTETWNAGNCYVGKYADVDGQIETEYKLILQGLDEYLQSGRRVYVNL